MNYARLPDVLPDLNGAGVTSEDMRFARLIEEASDRLRGEMSGRCIHSVLDTRYYDGSGSSELWLGDDLLSITTLKTDDDGDGVFENTWATTDYTLWPDNPEPFHGYRRIDVNPVGDYGPFVSGRRRVQIVGKFGMTEIQQAVIINGAQITGALSSASDLTLTTSAAIVNNEIAVGDTLFVATEEVGPVLSVSSSTVTLQARGINGTTAATHTTSLISLRRYPAKLEGAVRTDVGRYAWSAAGGYADGSTGDFREKWPAIAAVAVQMKAGNGWI